MRAALLALAALSLLVSACDRGQQNAELAAANAEAAKAFLEKNAKAEGVQTLPSGLQYQVVRSGPADGRKPGPRDEVKVHYEGKLLDGTVFDSSYERGIPAVMPLNRLIPAWQEAIPQMRPGDEWTLYVPPKMGYGERGAGNGEIPPNSVLIFRIELIGSLPPSSDIGKG